MVASNPFFHRGPVRDPAYFFGRRPELAYLFDLVRQGQSVSISAPRRFGKTSLLIYAANPDVVAQNGLDPSRVQWVHLDGGLLDGLSEEWLYGSVGRVLGGRAETIPLEQFVDMLRSFIDRSAHLIVSLDEFELIASNPRFDPTFFNRLRGLAAQFPLQFVTASKEPLARLQFASSETRSSPFFNNFAPLRLRVFEPGEAAGLLTTLSERGGQTFSPETVSLLIKWVGRHPLFLQVAGYRAFSAQHDGQLSPTTRDSVREQIAADVEDHLRYYWDGLSTDERYALAALPFLPPEGRDPVVERLDDLGLVSERAYSGGVVEAFVRSQRVDGLLQAGPFVMDTRRRTASVNRAPVHLTPTEFAALKLLLERCGELLTPEDIEAALWPGEIAPDPERARGIMKKLRAALGPAGEAVANVRGQGYILRVK